MGSMRVWIRQRNAGPVEAHTTKEPVHRCCCQGLYGHRVSFLLCREFDFAVATIDLGTENCLAPLLLEEAQRCKWGQRRKGCMPIYRNLMRGTIPICGSLPPTSLEFSKEIELWGLIRRG